MIESGGSRALTRVAAFLAMATVWGLTWIAARWATEAVPPIFLASVRLLAASLLFLAWCLAAGHRLTVAQPGRLLAASLLLNTACYSLLFWGLARTPTGIAGVVNMSLMPVFSMHIGALYREEQITARRLLAVALGAVGLALLFGGGGMGSGGAGEAGGLGLAAVVLATVSYAWGSIVSKPLVRTMPAISVAFWETLVGGVALVPLWLALEGWDTGYVPALLAPRPLASFAFLVLGGSLVGFSIYLWLLREWGAFRAGLYAFVSPAIAVAAGVAVLGEPFGPWEAVGMAVMFGAAALAVGPTRRRELNAS